MYKYIRMARPLNRFERVSYNSAEERQTALDHLSGYDPPFKDIQDFDNGIGEVLYFSQEKHFGFVETGSGSGGTPLEQKHFRASAIRTGHRMPQKGDKITFSVRNGYIVDVRGGTVPMDEFDGHSFEGSIMSWNPPKRKVNDSTKMTIPWGYLVDNERRRRFYFNLESVTDEDLKSNCRWCTLSELGSKDDTVIDLAVKWVAAPSNEGMAGSQSINGGQAWFVRSIGYRTIKERTDMRSAITNEVRSQVREQMSEVMSVLTTQFSITLSNFISDKVQNQQKVTPREMGKLMKTQLNKCIKNEASDDEDELIFLGESRGSTAASVSRAVGSGSLSGSNGGSTAANIPKAVGSGGANSSSSGETGGKVNQDNLGGGNGVNDLLGSQSNDTTSLTGKKGDSLGMDVEKEIENEVKTGGPADLGLQANQVKPPPGLGSKTDLKPTKPPPKPVVESSTQKKVKKGETKLGAKPKAISSKDLFPDPPKTVAAEGAPTLAFTADGKATSIPVLSKKDPEETTTTRERTPLNEQRKTTNNQSEAHNEERINNLIVGDSGRERIKKVEESKNRLSGDNRVESEVRNSNNSRSNQSVSNRFDSHPRRSSPNRGNTEGLYNGGGYRGNGYTQEEWREWNNRRGNRSGYDKDFRPRGNA